MVDELAYSQKLISILLYLKRLRIQQFVFTAFYPFRVLVFTVFDKRFIAVLFEAAERTRNKNSTDQYVQTNLRKRYFYCRS